MWEFEPYTLDLSDIIRLSDDDLFRVCMANPDLRIERNADGQLEIALPNGIQSDARATKIVVALGVWNEAQPAPGLVIGGTAGFFLPNRAMRAPDAAWISAAQWSTVPDDERDKFAHVVPDFVVEVRSPSDRLHALEAKMMEWIANGCRLAWMIDPIKKTAVIHLAGGRIERFGFESILSGEDILPGFEFDLRTLP